MSTADTRTVRPPAKVADAELQTKEHREWRGAVMRRAGWKCEKCGVQGGYTGVRLFADHIVERQDGGDPLDVNNGMALCGSCHTKKTAQARARRFSCL